MTSTKSDRVDGLTTDQAIKAPVIVATTANITLSGTQTIDGVAVVADDRVLVKDQTTASGNGIYLCKASTWTRARDCDGARDLTEGTLFIVNQGTTQAETIWRLTNTGTITIGTTSLTFEIAQGFISNAGNVRWNFDSSTTMADPGSGDLRLNNATLSSVTAVALSATSNEVNSPDFSDYIVTWDDSTNTTLYGTIIITKLDAPQNFAVYSITGTVTDNTTWLQLTVTYVAASGSFSSADRLGVSFIRTGDKGTTGATGATGDTGATGAQGATGPEGRNDSESNLLAVQIFL